MSKDFDSDLVRKLANLLHETGLEELEYATNEWKIRVARPSSVAVTSGQAPRPLPDPITPNDFSNEDKKYSSIFENVFTKKIFGVLMANN